MKKVIAAAATIVAILVLLLVGYFVSAPSRIIKEKTLPTTVWSLKLDGEVAKDWQKLGIRVSMPRAESRITKERAIKAAEDLKGIKAKQVDAYYVMIDGVKELNGDRWIVVFKDVNGIFVHPTPDWEIAPGSKNSKAPVDDGIVRYKNLYKVVDSKTGKAFAIFAPGFLTVDMVAKSR